MKNKQINKFLLMFFLSFTLFFSVSNAIEINQQFYSSNVSSNNSNLAGYSQTTLDTVGTYALEDAQSILSDYLLNGNSSNFDSLVSSIFSTYNENKYVLYSYYRDSKGYYYGRLYTWNSETTDIGKFGTTLGLVAGSDFHYISFAYGSTNSLSCYKETYTNTSLDKVYQCANFHTYVDSLSFFGSNSDIKEMTYKSGTNSYYYWDGTSYYYEAPEEPNEPEIPTLTDSEFSSMLNEIITSELFYQHIPSNYRNNFFVQHDVESDNYLFYFYPSNYQVNGLRRNENDYHIFCDKDFSWWDNVVDFLKKKFTRETENLDYEMIYVKVQEDGIPSCWYRSKLMLNVDETLFNFDLHPIVYSSVQIPFYGQHGGGGIDLDSGDKTIATEPEYVVNNQVYGETNIVYNPTPVEKVSNEQDFWDKVVNRLSSVVSYVKDIPSNIINSFYELNGFKTFISFTFPLISGIAIIIGVLISSIALISRAVTFIYTLPTIEPSSALFNVDVAETTKGLSFVGNSWGARFLEGLDMLRNFSWNGLNLWNLFSAFIAAMFAIQVVKYIRKHYHY